MIILYLVVRTECMTCDKGYVYGVCAMECVRLIEVECCVVNLSNI